MKRFFLFTAGILIGAGLIWGQKAFSDSQPDPAALWDFISNEKPYNRWPSWPDHSGLRQGRSPHGVFHKIYVNPTALKAKSPPLSNGSVIVKENFNESKELTFITVMYKVRGYGPETGDWYWVKYTPEGGPDESGKPESCIGCHSNRAEMDYVMVHSFK